MNTGDSLFERGKFPIVGRGSDAESAALQAALSGLSEESFSRLRVCYEVPGRPRGPHVSATELIQVVTGTTQQNSSLSWGNIKRDILNTSGACVQTFRFPGQRGRSSEVVDIYAIHMSLLQTSLKLQATMVALVHLKYGRRSKVMQILMLAMLTLNQFDFQGSAAVQAKWWTFRRRSRSS